MSHKTQVKLSLESPVLRWIIVGMVAATYWMMAVTAASDKSVTFDEIAHLTGGYTYWLRSDFRLNPVSGMLPQRLAGLPLLFMHPAFPPTDDSSWSKFYETGLGYDMLFRYGNDATRLLMAGRMMIALLGAALVLLAYQWAGELFGWRGGFVSMLLCAFCPTLLAHGALVTSDMAAAFFFTFAAWAFWRLCQRVTAGRFLVCALALTGLLLSKMSGVIILPVMAALLVVRLLPGTPLIIDFRGEHILKGRMRVALALIAIMLANGLLIAGGIWSAYSFRYGMFNPALPDHLGESSDWARLTNMKGLVISAVMFARSHHLLPEGYLYGFAGTVSDVKGRIGFLNGAYSWVGFPGFFPYAFLVKTSLTVFCLLAFAAFAGLRKWRTAGQWLYGIAPLLILFATYWAFALRSHLNIGHRHLLPVYPPMYILAGACGIYLKPGGRRWQALLVVACMLGFIAESLIIRPDYLTYFNVIAGGPDEAWRHLVDSSLDWGQDLPALKRWLDAHGKNNPDAACLAYFGTADPGYYGIKARVLSVSGEDADGLHPFKQGVYCISATALQSVYTIPKGHWARPYENAYRTFTRASGEATGQPSTLDKSQARLLENLRFGRLCAWLRQRDPDVEIGHSIFLYFLTDEQLSEALYGKPAELLPGIQIRMTRD
ncbi:MAG: glycosyltransferase family 39 protein [Chthoniobacteraceae bacterium]